MATICPKRDAVNVLLPEARKRGLEQKNFWPTSNHRGDWRFFFGETELVLAYFSQPFSGGLGPQEKVAVFVSADEIRNRRLVVEHEDIYRSDVISTRFAVLLRRATDLEYEASGGLGQAMSLLEPVDVGTERCYFGDTGVSVQFNFAG